MIIYIPCKNHRGFKLDIAQTLNSAKPLSARKSPPKPLSTQPAEQFAQVSIRRLQTIIQTRGVSIHQAPSFSSPPAATSRLIIRGREIFRVETSVDKGRPRCKDQERNSQGREDVCRSGTSGSKFLLRLCGQEIMGQA